MTFLHFIVQKLNPLEFEGGYDVMIYYDSLFIVIILWVISLYVWLLLSFSVSNPMWLSIFGVGGTLC
jgi:hypothetical protein